jgi:hypothetical protein
MDMWQRQISKENILENSVKKKENAGKFNTNELDKPSFSNVSPIPTPSCPAPHNTGLPSKEMAGKKYKR